MVFSSSIFLFLFLPFTLLFYWLVPAKYKNLILLAASLFFYSWGEPKYVLIILISIVINYFSGLLIKRNNQGKLFLTIGISANLAILIFFKYIDFFVTNIFLATHLNELFDTDPYTRIVSHFPIGISFFTFQAMSYLIDVYRGFVSRQKSIIDFALYISLFPQLIAGPIVRYKDIEEEINNRSISLDKLNSGIQRFIIGLGKKVLLANAMGSVADSIFGLEPSNLYFATAWLGVICYSFQIYFDFSGYSDMAIGLGKMFGFTFPENFNFPYISKSIKEFWRRWHISLSNWFRDYLYIPLGGNKKGAAKTNINLLIVFILCGFWHGASWNFLAWGLFHGTFLVLERNKYFYLLDNKLPVYLKHVYCLLVVLVGWVFFRAETLTYSLKYLASMFLLNVDSAMWNASITPDVFLNNKVIFILFLSVAFSTPIVDLIKKLKEESYLFNEQQKHHKKYLPFIFNWAYTFALLGIFLLSILNVISSTYNPFIYYRF